MLRKLFGFLSWQMTLLVMLAFWLLTSLAVAVAQAVNPFDNNVFAFFSDPVLFATTVTALSGWLTELITDALKDCKVEMRGWHTRLIAGGVASVLAGVGGYFGLSYFTGLTGVEGAYTAAGMALGSWLFADVKHRAGQLIVLGLFLRLASVERLALIVLVAGLMGHGALVILVPALEVNALQFVLILSVVIACFGRLRVLRLIR